MSGYARKRVKRLFSCFREKCVLNASWSGLSRVDHTLTPPVPFIAHFSSEVCEEWHTISNLGNLCAKNFSFFLLKFLEAEPAWHTKPEKADLCAKVDRD